MRLVVQRVLESSVKVDGREVGRVGKGFMVLCGVEDGDKVEEAGICFDVLHTPGHTPGSVCYLHEKSLFCGDTLFYQGYGRVDLAGGSETAMMTSLARLMKLPDDTVCYPGHGMKTKIAWERGTQA